MAQITSGKMKTNMFLIWAGPGRQDIYDSFNLTAVQHHDIDYVMQQLVKNSVPLYVTFELQDSDFLRFTRSKVTIDTFYNRILKICNQCEFSDPDERLIDAIVFGTSIVKAQDKLLQTLKTLNLQQCLTMQTL